MGDENTGDMNLVMEATQPATQFGPHLGIQGTERLVQKQHLRLHRQSTRQGDPLALPSGKLRRIAVRLYLQLYQPEQLHDLIPDLFLGGARTLWTDIETESDIVKNGHVPEERIVLKDKSYPAFTHVALGRVLAIEQYAAAVGRFQSGNDAEQRRLAAAGRAKQSHQFA